MKFVTLTGVQVNSLEFACGQAGSKGSCIVGRAGIAGQAGFSGRAGSAGGVPHGKVISSGVMFLLSYRLQKLIGLCLCCHNMLKIVSIHVTSSYQ